MEKMIKQTVIIAETIIALLFQSLEAMDKLINNEIEPGPANKGIASGLKEMSSFVSDSSKIGPCMSFLCCEFKSKNPDLEMMIAPAS